MLCKNLKTSFSATSPKFQRSAGLSTVILLTLDSQLSKSKEAGFDSSTCNLPTLDFMLAKSTMVTNDDVSIHAAFLHYLLLHN